MSRVLKGTIHVPNADGSVTSVFGGTKEADAKKQAGADVVGGWGEHVWTTDGESEPEPVLPVSPVEDAADESSSHRTRSRGRASADSE